MADSINVQQSVQVQDKTSGPRGEEHDEIFHEERVEV